MEANRLSIDRAATPPVAGNSAHRRVAAAPPPRPALVPTSAPREFFIQGLTSDGKAFRPSDWAERLAGAMACFRPGGAGNRLADYIGYSPYCVPRSIDNGVKCVLVNEALRELEPIAWDFVMSFARDNQLRLSEASPRTDRPGS